MSRTVTNLFTRMIKGERKSLTFCYDRLDIELFLWVLEDEYTLIDQSYLALHLSHGSSIKTNDDISMINQQVEITMK